MGRPNARREANMRWVEAVELFHEMYIGEGPYKSNVPRLVKEIVARLGGDEDLRDALLSEFGKRGARVRNAKAKPVTRLPSSPVQHTLFDGV